MVVTRSGKNTSYDSRTALCGHQCCTVLFKCCACEDTRPVRKHYVAEHRSNLFEVSYVPRSHYYCPTCKATAPPPPRSDRQRLAERPVPEPVKIDFSKMKRKPASDPALFQPTPSPTPPTEWRIHILKTLNAELRKMYESSENTAVGLRTEIKLLEAELDEMHVRLKGAVESIKYLTEQIYVQFKIPSPM